MKILKHILSILIILVPMVAIAQPNTLVIGKAWVKAPLKGASASAAYLSITNPTGKDDALIGVRTPVASMAMLHSMEMQNGIMRMRGLKSLEIKAGETVLLQPGGNHIMLMGLTQPLRTPSFIPFTFIFRNAGEITVEIPVR